MKLLAQVEDEASLSSDARSRPNSLVKLIKIAFDQGLDQLCRKRIPQILRERYQLMFPSQAVQAMHFLRIWQRPASFRRVKWKSPSSAATR